MIHNAHSSLKTLMWSYPGGGGGGRLSLNYTRMCVSKREEYGSFFCWVKIWNLNQLWVRIYIRDHL